MNTYEITYSNGNGIYSANLVIAESAEQATAYYTAEGREVIGCTETMSRPKPGQPVVTVPEGWTAPAAETETETAPAAEPETETVETKAYRMSYRDGRGGYPEIIVLAESAEQATAYYTAEYGVAVVSCDETSWPTPEQPRGIVPIGWTAADAETEATETTETTETAAETIEATKRAAEIADILDDVRCEIVAGYYRKKRRVTARCIREAGRAGVPTVRVGYCGAQWLLSYLTPAYYTAGVYGWNCDVYTVAGLNICTGYRGMVGAPAVRTADYERRAAAAAGEDERNAILAEWIAANLDAIRTARGGVRA